MPSASSANNGNSIKKNTKQLSAKTTKSSAKQATATSAGKSALQKIRAQGDSKKTKAPASKPNGQKKAKATATPATKAANAAKSPKATRSPKIAQAIKAPKAPTTTKAGKTAAQKAAKAPAMTATKQNASNTSAPKAKNPKIQAHMSTESAQGRIAVARAWLTKSVRDPKVIVPVVLVAVYLLGCLLFSSRYLPGTTINGDSVSFGSAKTAVKKAEGKLDGYTLKVEGDGIGFSVKSSDVDLAFDADAYASAAKAYIPSWGWPIQLIESRDFEITEGVSYDKRKLAILVNDAVQKANDGATEPESATISYNDSKKSFVAVDEKGGTAISGKSVLASTSHGMKTLQTNVELGDEQLDQPAISADDPRMQQALEQANKIASLDLELTIDGKKVKTVDHELVRSWLTIDESYNVVGDLELITNWTTGDLSAEVDTVGTARTYTRTSDGKRIEVYGGGTYGWNIDGAKLAEEICKSIKSGSSDPIEIPMQSKAEVYVHGKQDWGPRYVDVDLTEQYVRFFDEDSNIIMESECVSGDISTNDGTVTGVFALEGKESPKKLIGLDNDGDGEPDYESDVQYWMPFFGGYGLHDALWRDYFGADVYQVAGSHGCVNLPYYSAELLYNEIKVGDVVVVHY